MENQSLRPLLEPWFHSIANPHQAQEQALSKLIGGYRKTQYGQEFGADKVSSINDFQRAFPVVTYADLKPHIEKVMQGDFSTLLPEPPTWRRRLPVGRGGCLIMWSEAEGMTF